MNSAGIEHRYQFGLALIKEAGALASSYFHRRGALTIKSKGVQDMASEADLNTELLIKNKLAAAFPGDAFLGEETGITSFAAGQGIWVVDPINGTQPFISGLTSWCVSIAFVIDNMVRFGMVFAPERDELFAGGAGHPATLNGKPDERATSERLNDGIVGVGYNNRTSVDVFLPMFAALLRQGGTFSREGSGALTLCYVACGRLLGYIELHINSWDCLGAIAVLHAAGLRTNDFLGQNGLHTGNRLIAGSDSIYPQLCALLETTPTQS